MAETEKQAFPRLPAKNWWDLRARFARHYPTSGVDAAYLQSVLGFTSEGSAANLLPTLRLFGLIDEVGKPTDRAADWRTDAEYPRVCAEMLEEVYPAGLRDAFPPPSPDRAAVTARLARDAKVGQGAASAMAAFYLLLCEADPTKKSGTGEKAAPAKRVAAAKKAAPAARQQRARERKDDDKDKKDPPPPSLPSFNVNVQVHIASDTTPEQIEKVFESIAKHLPATR